MKALVTHAYGDPLQIEDAPDPTPGPSQVLVRVLATSLNPIDPHRASGALKEMFPVNFPWIPGGDFCGTIESLGPNVTGLEVGQSVFGYNPAGGAYAEHIPVDTATLTPRPETLSVEQAAGLPVAALTALQALALANIDPEKPSLGKSILIHAGAGGVGSMAIQFAHAAGLKVITTARPTQAEALQSLGADQVIDHSKEQFDQVLGNQSVDAVLDLVGGETLARSYNLIKPNGHIITANQPPDPAQCSKHNIHGDMVRCTVTTENLNHLLTLLEKGIAKPITGHTETLWNPTSLWNQKPSGTTVGKTIFTL